MGITPISNPLPGERVIALAPATLAETAHWWLRRPNLFAGRTLTAPTLEARQQWAAGHVALRGQGHTPGVVHGLEAALVAHGDGLAGARVALAQGTGLTVGGEDVRIAQAVELALAALPVVAAPSVFVAAGGDAAETGGGATDADAGAGAGDGDGSTTDAGTGESDGGAADAGGAGSSGAASSGASTAAAGGVAAVLRARIVGSPLGSVVAQRPDALPRVGIVVLQPVAADRIGAFDPTDPCPLDGCSGRGNAAAFEDWRIGDAARLLWYAWPDEWLDLPPLPPSGVARWRNLLAWRIFDAERRLGATEALPWERFGVPVALVACAADWTPLFLDRASVVRAGGRARYARLAGGADRLTSHWRAPALWQAQLEQFAEQIAASGDPAPAAAQLAAGFVRLPPFGLLPAHAVDLAALRSDFFPPAFVLDAAPLPLEQLDAALAEAAALAPLDTSLGERVRVLVPVPQALFEPRLLLRETLDPQFAATLADFVLRRARALGARQGLRVQAAAVVRAIAGRALDVPEPDDDPEALEAESLAPWGPPPDGGGRRAALRAGVQRHAFEGASETLAIGADDVLFAWVHLDPDHPPRTLRLHWRLGAREHAAYWGEPFPEAAADGEGLTLHAGELPPAGQWLRLELPAARLGLGNAVADGMGFALVDGRAAFAATGVRARDGGERGWFDGLLPAGARVTGDAGWERLAHNDLWAPFEPLAALVPLDGEGAPGGGGHAEPPARGLHQHFFDRASASFTPAAGERLYAWVFLDPQHPPAQLMLQWYDGSGWEHRAYWGLSRIAWGVEGSASRRRIAALPQPARWIRLEVAAADVGLAGTAVAGMAFTLFDGAAAFGASGALGADGAERVWFAGALPAGARPQGSWNFLAARALRTPTTAGRNGHVAALARLFADPALAHLSAHERYQLYARGLDGFVAYLKARADRADDLVDHGFLKVQTDIYRVRQLVLDATTATRLAVSPTLAGIAKAETAAASTARVAEFFAQLKAAPPPSAPPSVGIGGPGDTGGSGTGGGTIGTAPASGALTGLGSISTHGGVLRSASESTGTLAGAGVLGATAAVGALDPRLGVTTSLTGSTTGIVAGSAVGMIGGLTDAGLVAGGATGGVTGSFASGAPSGAAAALTGATFAEPLVRAERFVPSDITQAAPLIGRADVRTVSIAERLAAPKATEARDYTTATRYDAVASLVAFADELAADDGGDVPGLFEGVALHGLRGDAVLFYDRAEEVGSPNRPLPSVDDPAQSAALDARPRSLAFTTLLGERWRLPLLLRTPLRTHIDEAVRFSEGADLSDNTVALMRQLEGRIKLYRDAIVAAAALREQLARSAAALDARVLAAGEALAEARHDVAVTRALLAEEQTRLAAINARRARVLREHVRFVAYQRAREAELIAPAPLRTLSPGLAEALVPACLHAHEEPPDALAALLAVVREAPAQWFAAAPALLDRLDRVDLIVRTVQSAQLRSELLNLQLTARPVLAGALRIPAGSFAAAGASVGAVPGALATELSLAAASSAALTVGATASVAAITTAIAGLHGRRLATVQAQRAAAARIDVAALAALGWQGARRHAESVVSLGDLIDGEHGSGELAHRAAALFADIGRIAACLHAGFGAVPPAIRLDWATRLSQFDVAPRLRNLAGLPRWGELGAAERRALQAWADWLFGQARPADAQAEALINDVVHMCLLLASHAPVGRILAGRLAAPASAAPGARLTIRVDQLAQLRVGMQALVHQHGRVVARARVDDLAAGQASATVLQVAGARVDLAADARVHFVAADSPAARVAPFAAAATGPSLAATTAALPSAGIGRG